MTAGKIADTVVSNIKMTPEEEESESLNLLKRQRRNNFSDTDNLALNVVIKRQRNKSEECA